MIYIHGKLSLVDKLIDVKDAKRLSFCNLLNLSRNDIVFTPRCYPLVLFVACHLKGQNKPRLVYCTDGLISPLLKSRSKKSFFSNTLFDYAIINQPYFNPTDFSDSIVFYNISTKIKLISRYSSPDPRKLFVVLPKKMFLGFSKLEFIDLIKELKSFYTNSKILVSSGNLCAVLVLLLLRFLYALDFEIIGKMSNYLDFNEKDDYVVVGPSSFYISMCSTFKQATYYAGPCKLYMGPLRSFKETFVSFTFVTKKINSDKFDSTFTERNCRSFRISSFGVFTIRDVFVELLYLLGFLR